MVKSTYEEKEPTVLPSAGIPGLQHSICLAWEHHPYTGLILHGVIKTVSETDCSSCGSQTVCLTPDVSPWQLMHILIMLSLCTLRSSDNVEGDGLEEHTGISSTWQQTLSVICNFYASVFRYLCLHKIRPCGRIIFLPGFRKFIAVMLLACPSRSSFILSVITSETLVWFQQSLINNRLRSNYVSTHCMKIDRQITQIIPAS